MRALLRVDNRDQAKDFVSLFLELEVARFFTVKVVTPNHAAPIRIELSPNPEVDDRHDTWGETLRRSFKDGMLRDWYQYATYS